MAWVHAHPSEYGFYSDPVFVWGGSAGGYLASMVATANYPSIYLEDCPHEYPSGNALRAAVVFYGLFDFTNVDDFSQSDLESNLPVFWGATYEEMPVELLEEMSPILHVDETDPPFILIHGTADTQLPHVMSERFADALEEAGVDVELLLVPDVGHAFEQILTTSAMATTLDQLNGFLEHNLGIG